MSLTLSLSPEEIHTKFHSLATPQDVANLLDVDLKRLYYHIYVVPESARYTMFDIGKRSGGIRTISAPATALKIIQRKLNLVLLVVYQPKPCVHSFVSNRSIVSNASLHVGRRNILNVDLKDFFPSINFGRVRGLFMGKPYKLNSSVSTVLAQICCFNNELPQGAPTSPIVSNMICAQMDSWLMSLAKENRCDYTRYADDITFSSNMREFPSTMVSVNEFGQPEIGTELSRIINENGFQINPDKIRLRHRSRHQEVTGLTTNRFPNVRRRFVRQIRAMLHAWEKFGLENAEREFSNIHDKKHRNPTKPTVSFKRVVKGKIDFLRMVRGELDPIYLQLLNRLAILAPELVKAPVSITLDGSAVTVSPLIMTEGKSDWKHLKAALRKLQSEGHYTGLDIQFEEHEHDIGDVELHKTCRALSRTTQAKPTIFVFDRDNPSIMKNVSGVGGQHKDWGNNVCSFVIPIPKHREATPEISIEFYYKDSEIKQQDEAGRRLFLNDEFDRESSRHKELNLNCTTLNKIKRDAVSIIDSAVYDEKNQNVALPKDDFATYILNEAEGFNNFDFTEFRRIFNVIIVILKTCKT